ncbi:PTS system mannose/fructose/sorbose family transporter subunit IID [Pseudodesulfovibrio thermohalotolerans]|uniref:PTS system mannose/fructose/sorbose family transporter subunit IID n=1 Tax=Pseudodesulfovibrio thermohalotolerans TaxID=2880651 RepID=UPI0024435FAE|nr:PTS system mannose/fructose/sorbose family transporter subunit IID [Pseudodesulfovibrio thermohalotolerans]WFS62256.1 PTS system mannose/fructose/sorbose family transporter subunit IID [Pseudodesulfovibrio thermohalotolerans]
MAVHGFPRLQADTKTMAFLRSFLRCYLAGAAFNTRGMQNIGLMYAMQPGLRAIHQDPKELRTALKRYARHYQSHPFWTPCMVGILLNVETTISAGHFPAHMLSKVRDTTSYTLSAIGDSVFAGSLLIFWALLTICLLLTGYPVAAFLLGLFMFIGLQAFRAYTFAGGVKQGFRFLEKLRRWDLINWGTKVKYANAALLLWLWTLIWPRPYDWWEFVIGLAALMLFGRYVRTGILSRVLAVAVFVGFIELFPWIEALAEHAFGL